MTAVRTPRRVRQPRRVEITGGPWPERVGLTGIVVRARADGQYPQPGPNETLVRIPGDPLTKTPTRWWTCVMRARDLRYLP